MNNSGYISWNYKQSIINDYALVSEHTKEQPFADVIYTNQNNNNTFDWFKSEFVLNLLTLSPILTTKSSWFDNQKDFHELLKIEPTTLFLNWHGIGHVVGIHLLEKKYLLHPNVVDFENLLEQLLTILQPGIRINLNGINAKINEKEVKVFEYKEISPSPFIDIYESNNGVWAELICYYSLVEANSNYSNYSPSQFQLFVKGLKLNFKLEITRKQTTTELVVFCFPEMHTQLNELINTY